MTWLTWRQFRAPALTGLALLAAAAIYFLTTGLAMHHTYTADLASCTPQGNCGDVLGEFQRPYNATFHLTEILVIVAPALIGIFWGAPLIGRELEAGTHQFVWNQTVTRTRWLAVKLTIVGLASIAAAGILSYLLTWWAGPLDQINGDRFAATTFATRDIVPLGYSAFAFILGATAGLLMRRTVAAMAVTLVVFIGIQIVTPTLIRPYLLPSTTVGFAVNRTTLGQARGIYGQDGGAEFSIDGLPISQGAWVISAPPVQDSSGRVVAMYSHVDCFPTDGGPGPADAGPGPGGTTTGDGDFSQIGACLAAYDLHETVTYQPASHYWPLQWAEIGIFLALTSLLTGLCFWWIRRRQN